MSDFEMRNVCKSFPGVKALDNANFHADRGDIVALLGENGAGKSTLIKTLCGEYKPDSGEIYFEGKKLNITSTRNAIEQKICAVYQELSLVPELTIAENLFLGFYETNAIGRVDYKELEKRTLELFKKYDVDPISPKTKVKTLPLAQKQVLEILKALNRDGDIIIFDEPTRGIDVGAKSEIYELMDGLVHQGAAILMISSDLPEILGMSDRIYVMSQGQITGELEHSEATQEKILTLAYGQNLEGTEATQ